MSDESQVQHNEEQQLADEIEEIVLGENGKPLSKKALKKLEKEKEKEAKKAEAEAKRREQQANEKAEEEANDCAKEHYGILPIIQSTQKTGRIWTSISSLSSATVGQRCLIRARIHSRRGTSKQTFLVLRQSFDTLQAIVYANNVSVSKQMVKFAANLSPESIVDIEGTIAAADVKSCTQKEIELSVERLFVVSEVAARLPISVEDASRPDADENASEEEEKQFATVKLSTKLDHRIIDLRTITNQAIFRIQSGVVKLFREYLERQDFVKIHTPKMISAASEGGANVFKINYFKGSAFLAQSPQLYKQMMVSSDFGRVFECAPVFRAEESFTHRHMTEFIGFDIEMAFHEHYYEVLDVLGNLFFHLFTGLETRFAKEIEIVRMQYPSSPIQFSEKPLILPFWEGIAMLREDGVTDVHDLEDINTTNEKRLGVLVKKKYGTDFYILDKYPMAARPFYTMPSAEHAGYSNSYDFFIRGEEILSGAQRIHEPALLEARAKECGVDLGTIAAYIDAFRYGAYPHGGAGIGLERVVMLYLNLGNIRKSCLFPRDPKRLTP